MVSSTYFALRYLREPGDFFRLVQFHRLSPSSRRFFLKNLEFWHPWGQTTWFLGEEFLERVTFLLHKMRSQISYLAPKVYLNSEIHPKLDTDISSLKASSWIIYQARSYQTYVVRILWPLITDKFLYVSQYTLKNKFDDSRSMHRLIPDQNVLHEIRKFFVTSCLIITKNTPRTWSKNSYIWGFLGESKRFPNWVVFSVWMTKKNRWKLNINEEGCL